MNLPLINNTKVSVMCGWCCCRLVVLHIYVFILKMGEGEAFMCVYIYMYFFFLLIRVYIYMYFFFLLFLAATTSAQSVTKRGRKNIEHANKVLEERKQAELAAIFDAQQLTAKSINLPLSLLSRADEDIESRVVMSAQKEAVKEKLRGGWSAGHTLVGVCFGYHSLGSDISVLHPPSLKLSDDEVIQRLQANNAKVQVISGGHRLAAMKELVMEDRGKYSALFSSIPTTVYLFDMKTSEVRVNLLAQGMQLNNIHMGAAVSWEGRILFERKDLELRKKTTPSWAASTWEAFTHTIRITNECEALSAIMCKTPSYLRDTVRFALMEPKPWSYMKQILERNLELRIKKANEKEGRRKGGEQDRGVSEALLAHVLKLPTLEQELVLSDIVAGRVKGQAIVDKCELVRASGILCANIPLVVGLTDWAECCQRFPSTFSSAFIQLWMGPTRKNVQTLPGKFKSVNKAPFESVCPAGLKPILENIKATVTGANLPNPVEHIGSIKVFTPQTMNVAAFTRLVANPAELKKVSDHLSILCVLMHVCLFLSSVCVCVEIHIYVFPDLMIFSFTYICIHEWLFSFLHIYVFPFTQNAWNVFVVRKGSNWAVSVLGDAYKFDEFVQHHLRQHIGMRPNDTIEWGEWLFVMCLIVQWDCHCLCL